MPSSTPAKRPQQVKQKKGKAQSSGLEAIIPDQHGNAKRLKIAPTVDAREPQGRVPQKLKPTVIRDGDTADIETQDLPAAVIEISSDSDSDSDDTGSEEEEDAEPLTTKTNGLLNPTINGDGHPQTTTNGDVSMVDAHDGDEDEDEAEEEQDTGAAADSDAEQPSFGELLRNMSADVVDVEAAFAHDASSGDLALISAQSGRALSAPNATSLGTVLTQALRTNDKELLESCFSINDLDSVRSTIERLPSPLVGSLLETVSKRLRKRPGRAGNLLVWLQWAFVCHGGYLATQPQVMKKMRQLEAANRERTKSLQALLSVKGKLDMLSAQVELRRQMHERAVADGSDSEGEAVIYVEGEEDDDDDEDEEGLNEEVTEARTADVDMADTAPLSRATAQKLHPKLPKPSDNDAIPTAVNGAVSDSDSDSDDVISEDEARGLRNGIFDEEAEETDSDSGDDDSSDSEGSDDSMDDAHMNGIGGSENDDDDDDDDDEDDDRKPSKRAAR